MHLRIIQWQDRFNLDVEAIDTAHQQLFSIVNKITDLVQRKRGEKFACIEGIKYFKSYALRHFKEEEAFMREIGYPGYPAHKHLHDQLRDETIPALEQELEETDYSTQSIQRFLGFCSGWLSRHIMEEDQAIVGKYRQKCTHFRSGSEQAVLKEIIAFPMKELFDAEVQVVSTLYDETKMEESHYYELIYSWQEEPRLRITLIIENTLLLQLLEQVMYLQFEEQEEISISAIQELAQILMQHAADHFGDDDAYYQMTSNRFLTAEECHRRFSERYPQHSMIFGIEDKKMALCLDLLSQQAV